MVATSAACQAIWLRKLLAEITGRKEEELVVIKKYTSEQTWPSPLLAQLFTFLPIITAAASMHFPHFFKTLYKQHHLITKSLRKGAEQEEEATSFLEFNVQFLPLDIFSAVKKSSSSVFPTPSFESLIPDLMVQLFLLKHDNSISFENLNTDGVEKREESKRQNMCLNLVFPTEKRSYALSTWLPTSPLIQEESMDMNNEKFCTFCPASLTHTK
ncbi:hypothetical protein E3N88_09157 [Mikania micrantha]|uniref:Uncharacterized protein n=1 Tax=Mikania micrantha TaxID=192012 RepID=A0A5N6PK95_9ASTR|nr:hypothetical protein E3N88_09157 [Mikania micrantha]